MLSKGSWIVSLTWFSVVLERSIWSGVAPRGDEEVLPPPLRPLVSSPFLLSEGRGGGGGGGEVVQSTRFDLATQSHKSYSTGV